jgi:hypothetical protein
MKISKLPLLIVAVCAFAVAGCDLLTKDSPTATFKTYVEATQKKDVAAIKKTLSAETLRMLEGEAKMNNQTLDEMLRKDENAYAEMPETRNEKIAGERATLEVKNRKTGEWDTIPFDREDGKWKIALDRFLEELFKKLADDFVKPDSGESNANAAAKP